MASAAPKPHWEGQKALKLIGVVALLAACVYGQTQDHYSLVDNLTEKLSQKNLADKVAFGTPKKKYVPVVSGADVLLDHFESDPRYKKDQIWGRLAHTHPFSTVSYREKDNPSLHAVFRELPDGSTKAALHLDGNGPQEVFPHLDEFVFHKLTFQDNDQDRMNANLKRSLVRQSAGTQEVFTQRDRTLLYVHRTFGLQPIATALGNAMFRHYAHQLIWRTEPHYEPILSRLQSSLFRQTLRNTLEFGVASWRQEDTRYRPSAEHNVAARLRYAFVHAFVVSTPTGNEFAYARFAGIVGSAAASDAWHPWRVHSFHPNYYRQAMFGLAVDPLARSMWTEFGPDLMRHLRFNK